MKQRYIIKASGKKEPFKRGKIKSTLIRTGAPEGLADEVAQTVEEKIKEVASFDEIYKNTQEQLLQKRPELAAKYSLKRAIMKLGPEGYVFEKYVARILEGYGYRVKVGQIVKGYCVDHEIDVIARKKDKHFMIECKYHNRPGLRSDVKVALYTHSRFLDVERAWKTIKGHQYLFHQPWLVTNTRCTTEAIKYARCMNLRIIAWRYPYGRGLEYFIEKKRLYPVTILPSISHAFVNRLSLAGILTAQDLLKHSEKDITKLASINPSAARKLRMEARQFYSFH